MKLRSALALSLLSLSIIFPVAALAQWYPDGTPVCLSKNSSATDQAVSDGAGGMIVVWADFRNGSNYDIYAQRIDANGVVQWTADGAAVCTAANQQQYPTAVADGSGGVFITWQDARTGVTDIYAQRLNSAGVAQWTANGVAVCAATNTQVGPVINVDGAGGAIIAWTDLRSGTFNDIYAQRVNGSGVVQWTTDGVVVCNANFGQDAPMIVPDGAGGAVITWEDTRISGDDIYAQRINASGGSVWTANGVVLCGASGQQVFPNLVSDGAAGAIVTWQDARGIGYDIYAQRVNAAGAVQWQGDGVPLCTALSDQTAPHIVSDAAGGAIIAWTDQRSGSGDIYAQHVTPNGNVTWTANGTPLCTAASDQNGLAIIADGSAGAIVTWQDNRYDGATYHIYAQRVSALGAPQWDTDGMLLAAANGGSQTLPVIVPDASGNALVAWLDYRSGTSDVYAQRVEGRYGYWGRPEPTLNAVTDVPADQGGKVRVDWYASGRDQLNQQFIAYYTIWRATNAAAAQSASLSGVPRVQLRDVGAEFTGPAIREEKTATTDYFWELVGNQNATYRTAYSFTAPTNYDSTATGPATTQFQIVAHAYFNQYINWPSNVIAGHSVDNLAPAAPLFLTANRAGVDVHLKWNRVRVNDLKNYSVFRGTSSGVTPIPTNFLADNTDTVLVDPNAPTSALYYIVTANDVHGNQSAPSNEAAVSGNTGAGNLPPVTALTVRTTPTRSAARPNSKWGCPRGATCASRSSTWREGASATFLCRARRRVGVRCVSLRATTKAGCSPAACTSTACMRAPTL